MNFISETTTDNWEDKMEDNYVTINKETYRELIRNKIWLSCLEDVGLFCGSNPLIDKALVLYQRRIS